MWLESVTLVILASILVVLSSKCPPNEVVKPCICSESSNKLICIKSDSNDFNSTDYLADIFKRISASLAEDDEPFKQLMIVNTQTLVFKETLFSGLKFEELFIFENNLTFIHSKVFDKTFSHVKNVYMNMMSLKVNQPNYSLFQALSTLENLEVLALDFGINSITSIPDYAFNSTNVQNKLNEISINGRIQTVGQLAFAMLPNLTKLKILNEVQTIGQNSFEFLTNSSDVLQIDLSDNRLSATSFELSSFAHIRRPTNLILTRNKIKYLDKNVFGNYFDSNKNNRLVLTKNQLNCTDCRSYWLMKQMSDLSTRITDSNCESGQTIWDHQWNNCKNSSTDPGNNGFSYLYATHLLVISIFVSIKFVSCLISIDIS